VPPDDWLDRLLDLAKRETAEPHDLQPYAGAVLEHVRSHAATLRNWGPRALSDVLDAYVHRSALAAWYLLYEQVQPQGEPPDLAAADRIAARRAAFLEGLLRLIGVMALRGLHGLVARATERSDG